MNNKKLGTQFEQEFVQFLADKGWWVHFITPASDGGQPFDVIAVLDGKPYAVDCKTSATHIFPLSRLEENQVLAFQKWLACGNGQPFVAIKYNDNVYMIEYKWLEMYGKVDLNEFEPTYDWSWAKDKKSKEKKNGTEK